MAVPIKNRSLFPKTYALVMCGGNSSRMGTDKSMLIYHEKPQRYHVHEMLQPFCEKVFISCKEEQVGTMEPGYDILTDSPVYNNIGPVAALLTAFSAFPGKDILLIGCDYPFLTAEDLQQFSNSYTEDVAASAFYNEEEDIYEPLLAWYHHNSFPMLKKMYDSKQYSLQLFLKENKAARFYPGNKNSIKSVDTPGAILDSGYRIQDTG